VAVRRLEHIGVVVEDLADAVGFLEELGLAGDGEATVCGDWVDRIIGLEGAESRIAMLRTPDGEGCVELVEFLSPGSPPLGEPPASNVLGARHLAFTVDDLDDTVARLEGRGGELVGTIERYRDVYRLCYLRGPGGLIFELAEELR
jgi:catechol 2,3-dioxygenase-like lactoylglutathione lyase family enzyme